mgnify:CR=1 FL=1|jgi:hypothetical protein
MRQITARGLVVATLLTLGSGCSAVAPPPASELQKVVKLERELDKTGDDFDLRWQLAEACIELVEHPLTASADRLIFSEQALSHSDRAIALMPERVEGHFFRAVSTGHILDNQFLPDLSMIGDLESSGVRARELDPSFECAGPLLLLALLYQKAPAWPIGPELAGEEEEIEALFREAIRITPRCVENHIAYAEFLQEEDRLAEAEESAHRAEALLATAELLPYKRDEFTQRVRELLATSSN